ncbi:unnamed protein product, partial [Coregonus sp. 'balchen']
AEMKTKVLEAKHQEEKLKMQQKHDADVQKGACSGCSVKEGDVIPLLCWLPVGRVMEESAETHTQYPCGLPCTCPATSGALDLLVICGSVMPLGTCSGCSKCHHDCGIPFTGVVLEGIFGSFWLLGACCGCSGTEGDFFPGTCSLPLDWGNVILDRKNGEIEELKTMYRAKQKESEESVRKLEKKVQSVVRESQVICESKEKQIGELKKMSDQSTDSLKNEWEKKLHAAVAGMEQEKFELQKKHTENIQELLEDTNQRLAKMEAEYSAQTRITEQTVRELELRVKQLSVEVENGNMLRQKVTQEKGQMEIHIATISSELQEANRRRVSLLREKEQQMAQLRQQLQDSEHRRLKQLRDTDKKLQQEKADLQHDGEKKVRLPLDTGSTGLSGCGEEGWSGKPRLLPQTQSPNGPRTQPCPRPSLSPSLLTARNAALPQTKSQPQSPNGPERSPAPDQPCPRPSLSPSLLTARNAALPQTQSQPQSPNGPGTQPCPSPSLLTARNAALPQPQSPNGPGTQPCPSPSLLTAPERSPAPAPVS